jgi:HicA-like toxin of HicAB toxin-antitoxin system
MTNLCRHRSLKNSSRSEREHAAARFGAAKLLRHSLKPAMNKIGSGSHIILRKQTYPHRRIVVPDHKEVAKGTLRSIIRLTGLTVEEFKALL